MRLLTWVTGRVPRTLLGFVGALLVGALVPRVRGSPARHESERKRGNQDGEPAQPQLLTGRGALG